MPDTKVRSIFFLRLFVCLFVFLAFARAGRRGKDSSGSVILMRSRFEDCIEAHRLLLSPMDGIQSQFK